MNDIFHLPVETLLDRPGTRCRKIRVYQKAKKDLHQVKSKEVIASLNSGLTLKLK